MITCEQYIDDLDIKKQKFDIKGIKKNKMLKSRYDHRNQNSRVNDRDFIIATGIYHIFNPNEEWKNNLEYINDVLMAFGFHKVYPRRPDEVVYYYCLINNLTWSDFENFVKSDAYKKVIDESEKIDKRENLNFNEYKERYEQGSIKYEQARIKHYFQLEKKKSEVKLTNSEMNDYEDLCERYKDYIAKNKEDIAKYLKLREKACALNKAEMDIFVELHLNYINTNDKQKDKYKNLKERIGSELEQSEIDMLAELHPQYAYLVEYKDNSKYITIEWLRNQLLKEQVEKDGEKYTRHFTSMITNQINEMKLVDERADQDDFLQYLDNDYKRLYTLNYATTTYYFRKYIDEYISSTIKKVEKAQEKSREIVYSDKLDDYQSELLYDISYEIYDSLNEVPVQGKIQIRAIDKKRDNEYNLMDITDLRSSILCGYDNYGKTELDDKTRKSYQDREWRFDKSRINIMQLSFQLVDNIGICKGLNSVDEKKVKAYIYNGILDTISGKTDVERCLLFFVLAAMGKTIDEINIALSKCGFYIVQDNNEDKVLLRILNRNQVSVTDLRTVGLAPGKYKK